MASAAQSLTIAQHLPWVDFTMDYTERIVALIPDELLDYRPDDPSGRFFFSPAEIAMHLSDERREFGRMLGGNMSREGFWMQSNWETDGVGAPWQFRAHGSRDELLADLRAARAELAPWLALPVEQLQQQTPGTRLLFDKQLAMMRRDGIDTTAAELRGPATVNRVLFALCLHEAGHRSYLQTILRLQGVDARGDH